MSKGRGVLRAEHLRGDIETQADPAVFPADFQLADKGLHKRGLFLRHLPESLGIGKRHRANHAKTVEQCGNLEGVFRRVAFSVKSGGDVISNRLSREGQATNAAR